MAYDWTMFFDEYAGDFHPSFQEKLSKQLFKKGADTGIADFSEHNVQLIVGMEDLFLMKVGDRMYAMVEFITPTSFSFPTDIYWTASNTNDIETIHESDVSNVLIEFHWGRIFLYKRCCLI